MSSFLAVAADSGPDSKPPEEERGPAGWSEPLSHARAEFLPWSQDIEETELAGGSAWSVPGSWSWSGHLGSRALQQSPGPSSCNTACAVRAPAFRFTRFFRRRGGISVLHGHEQGWASRARQSR